MHGWQHKAADLGTRMQAVAMRWQRTGLPILIVGSGAAAIGTRAAGKRKSAHDMVCLIDPAVTGSCPAGRSGIGGREPATLATKREHHWRLDNRRLDKVAWLRRSRSCTVQLALTAVAEGSAPLLEDECLFAVG